MEEKFFGIKAFGATPSERQLSHLEMGKKAFFHFGVNTFSNLEWGLGTELEESFNPSDCDVRSWIRDIKNAGFKLAILTAKHHDGFCLWPSKYTTHTIAKSPYKNGNGDIVEEFCSACHEYGVRVGLYLSPWDRNSELWGKKEYSLLYAKQLTELLTNYGRIDEIWWDGAGSGETPYDWGLWAYLVRNYQPNAVMFGALGATPYVEVRWVGNEAGHAGDTHYASIASDDLYQQDVSLLNVGRIGGDRYIPAEVDVSIRPGWFYHEEQDSKVKSTRDLDKLWFKSIGSNAQMLLNFPPDRRGRLCEIDVKNAIESNRHIEKMLATNFIDMAKVTSNSAYNEFTTIEKATLKQDELFFATDKEKDEGVIDIELSGNERINCLILGEKVELGERITSFKLENLDTGTPQTLICGTSVGYKKAKLFDGGKYKKLRLTVKGVAKPLTLRTLGLYYYEQADNEEEKRFFEKDELTEQRGARVNFENGRKDVVLNFGGIYPFDSVKFKIKAGEKYRVSAFDGAQFYEIAKGVAKEDNVVINLENAIDGSYQIKIETENGFADGNKFSVM